MRTIASAYSNFGRMMLDDHIYEDPDVDYNDICTALRVSPDDLDEILLEELGMKGSEILQSFQKLLTLQAFTHTRKIFNNI